MADKTTEFRVAMRPGKRRALPDTPEGRPQDLIETAKAHIRSKVDQEAVNRVDKWARMMMTVMEPLGFQLTLVNPKRNVPLCKVVRGFSLVNPLHCPTLYSLSARLFANRLPSG
jgi:hypothetical protein